MTSRLALYNKALLLAGERALSALTDEVESRRLLDVVWSNGGVDECLSEGQWVFAMRTSEIDYDPSIEPTFGYARAFTKPSDHLLTSAFCSDGHFQTPITRYEDEQDYWYCDLDTVYVRYVSNDSDYGGDLGSWPAPFTEFAAAYFASKVILKLTNDTAKLRLFVNPDDPTKSIVGRALLQAKSRNMMAQPSRSMAQGNWTASRTRGGTRRDGGGTTNLIG